MLLLMYLGIVVAIFGPLSGRAEHRLHGGTFSVTMVVPVFLAIFLFWKALCAPRLPDRRYRGIPLLVGVLSFLITGMPLPGIDPAPTVITYLAYRTGGISMPIHLQRLQVRLVGLFDECQTSRDCDHESGETPRVCGMDLDGDRICVEVSGPGCCPTKMGCTEGWVCVSLGSPERSLPGQVSHGAGAGENCVREEVASRFREAEVSCAWRSRKYPFPSDY
jgi:uncharacterized membrane protein YhaH (DUF805 family)